ncbi:MAG: rubredoxin [Chitinophagaceae bacterium]
MIRKNHIVKINLHGGIVAAGNLYAIMCAAENAQVKEVQFGTRQQLYFKVADKFVEDFLIALGEAGIGYEANVELFPNIVSSYVTEEVFQNANWLSEGVYKDILDLFDFKPRLKINIVDSGQTFVPFFTGNINFIASPTSNYWYLHIRFPKTNNMYKWPGLIYTGDIPRISKLLEETISENQQQFAGAPQANGDSLPALVYAKANFITQPVEQELKLPDFTLPYYEGFNNYGNKTWLGIHRRDDQFDVAFLKDVCAICLKTKVGQLYTTPWKSLVIKAIQQSDRKLWNYVLGKFRINVRHASNELNWQVEDLSEEGLQLKRFLVRGFDKDDVRTYGLCFAVKTRPQSGLFGSVIIRKQENKAPNKYKMLDRYDILYTPDFNPNSKEFILFRKDIEKENLELYLVSLCKYFYEWQNEEVSNHAIYQQQMNDSNAIVTKDIKVHQCGYCFTIYDPVYGDESSGIAPGIAFNELENYECPTCSAAVGNFKQVTKPDEITA